MNNSTARTAATVCMVCSLFLILYTYTSSPRGLTGLGKLYFVFESMRATPDIKCTGTKTSHLIHHLFPFRGGFRIGFNIVKSVRTFLGNESITLTTTADYTFLDNLVTLVDLWPGPISCSLFAPGSDFLQTLQAIHYLRECTSPLIKQLVTFHVYFPSNHIPTNLSLQPWETFESQKRDCRNKFKFGPEVRTYRKLRKLLYHINVGRNIAREMAQTYFVLPLDIELYPSRNTISEFFGIVLNNEQNNQIHSSPPKVFVLPAFELHPNVSILPNTKEQLEKLFRDKLATIFHKNICEYCHHIPDLMGWLSNNYSNPHQNQRNNKDVFSVTKRMKGQVMWEPFYIGTKSEPEFDERVTWEGRSDKRVQAYALCLLDYDFYILKNIFVVHRPGIKYSSHENITIVKEMDEEIKRVIVPELQGVYGQRQGCNV